MSRNGPFVTRGIVLKEGSIAEEGPTEKVFLFPQSSYTKNCWMRLYGKSTFLLYGIIELGLRGNDMEIAGLLFQQILIMFILMSIGFVFYKIKFISDQGSKDMAKVLLYLVIPVVIVKNFMIERSAENVSALLSSVVVSLIAMGLAIIVSYVFFGKKDGVANFSSTFSNAGFIGIPLISATLGEGAVFYISMMIVLINALQWTYGVYVMSGDKSVMKPKNIITNPIVIAVVIGLVLFVSGIQMPVLVTDVFEIVSGLNTPLAMLVSGVYLAQCDLVGMLKKKNIYFVSFVRLILIPLITLGVFALVPAGNETIRMAVLIAAACPVGSNVAIFAQAYNSDYRSAVEQVCMSTILCLLTLPLVVMAAGMVL